MVLKTNGFLLGLGLFADPLIKRGQSYLDDNFPHWEKLLQLRNSLLKGVPTNAQLAITLLRVGEANNAPLPPPPYSSAPPPDTAHEGAGRDLDHLGKLFILKVASRSLRRPEGVTDHEKAQAIHPDNSSTTAWTDRAKPTKRRGRHFLASLKGATKGSVGVILGTDRLKAAAGAEHARNRLGVLRSGPEPLSGPVRFPARFQGKRGHAYITTKATGPALSWTTEREDIDPVFSIGIDDIQVCRISPFLS